MWFKLDWGNSVDIVKVRRTRIWAYSINIHFSMLCSMWSSHDYFQVSYINHHCKPKAARPKSDYICIPLISAKATTVGVKTRKFLRFSCDDFANNLQLLPSNWWSDACGGDWYNPSFRTVIAMIRCLWFERSQKWQLTLILAVSTTSLSFTKHAKLRKWKMFPVVFLGLVEQYLVRYFIWKACKSAQRKMFLKHLSVYNNYFFYFKSVQIYAMYNVPHRKALLDVHLLLPFKSVQVCAMEKCFHRYFFNVRHLPVLSKSVQVWAMRKCFPKYSFNVRHLLIYFKSVQVCAMGKCFPTI